MSAIPASSVPADRKGLRAALWVVQVLLALAFFAAGAMKSTGNLDELAKSMAWVGYSPGWLVRFVGVSEVLGAVGLVAPAATRVLPQLTPIAAGLLALVMALAIGMHGTHGELAQALPVNLVLGGLAVFVAWGRTGPARIAPRG